MKFKGIVKKHLGRGTILGFPTANIEPPKDLEQGIYIGTTIIEPGSGIDKKIPSAIFIGVNPTFNESYIRAESYLLDFEGDLYGKEIEIETLKRIRDVSRFETNEALVEQIQKDVQVVRDFFRDYNQTL